MTSQNVRPCRTSTATRRREAVQESFMESSQAAATASDGRVLGIDEDCNLSLAELIAARKVAWTAAQLAVLLSCSTRHVLKLAKAGKMPSIRLGGTVRFDPKATGAWLRSRAIPAMPVRSRRFH